jgi:hypothetical protein
MDFVGPAEVEGRTVQRVPILSSDEASSNRYLLSGILIAIQLYYLNRRIVMRGVVQALILPVPLPAAGIS